MLHDVTAQVIADPAGIPPARDSSRCIPSGSAPRHARRSSSSSSAAARPAGPARTPGPAAAAPPGRTGHRPGSSAHRMSPASGQGLRWGQRPPEDHHESSQTQMIRQRPPRLRYRHPRSTARAAGRAASRPAAAGVASACHLTPRSTHRRGEIWWVEFDERRPVVLLSEDEPSGFRAMQVVAPADTDISGLGIEVAVGVPEGLPFEGVLRFAFPWPGFTPCTWLTTLSRDDLIERAGAVSAAKLSEIDDALRASEQRTEWTPAAAARLSEIKDSLRRRTQADGEGTDAHADEGRSRPHDRRSAAPQQQDHDLRLEY